MHSRIFLRISTEISPRIPAEVPSMLLSEIDSWIPSEILGKLLCLGNDERSALTQIENYSHHIV